MGKLEMNSHYNLAQKKWDMSLALHIAVLFSSFYDSCTEH